MTATIAGQEVSPFLGLKRSIRCNHVIGLLRLATAVMVWLSPLEQPVPAQRAREIRRVLVFTDFSPVSSPGTATIDHAVAEGLNRSRFQIEMYHESLESTLFSDNASQIQIRDWLIHKYSDRRPDLIFTAGPSSLKFMIETHKISFPNIPIVFCGTTEDMIKPLKPDSDFAGVWGVAQPAKTLTAALKLLPKTKHVVVTGGVGSFEQSMEAQAIESFRSFETRLDFTYLTDLDMQSLLERLRHLPSNSIVYHTALTEDASGTHFIDSAQSVPLIANAANAPVFVTDDVDIGGGSVGGNVISWADHGRIAAEMAVKILDGAKPQDIGVVRPHNAYLFDWRALRRWDLKESDLQPNSVVLFREISLWERTRWIWIGGLATILGLTAVAIYLQINRRKLTLAKEAELELSGLLINAQEKERGRLASELHDDFSQRLALLAVGLDNASEMVATTPDEAKSKLHELLNSASELGADLHTLSHHLHSSTLEKLGLVPGISALCKEFTAQQGIDVDFTHNGIPRSVQPDSALCLFRIVQEGLRNLKKHSGATKASVHLDMVGDHLQVVVCDKGTGFDPKKLNDKTGLGLRSMEERANLLGGRFEVSSSPGHGTRIEARIPAQQQTGIPGT